MKKKILAVGLAVLLLAIAFSGCFEEKSQVESKTINFNIYVEEYFGGNVSNESLNVEVKEGDYFGVPSLSGWAYIDNGSLMFRLIEIIDDEHAKVQFNESMLYNFTDATLTRVYYDNPLVVDTNITRFTTRPLNEWLVIDPYPIIHIYLNITKSE